MIHKMQCDQFRRSTVLTQLNICVFSLDLNMANDFIWFLWEERIISQAILYCDHSICVVYFILLLPIDVGLGDMGVQIGLISCHVHEAFLLLKNWSFLCFKPVIFVCFYLYHSIISTSLYYIPLNHDSKQCFHGQVAISFPSITVPCCPHGNVPSLNVTGLQLIYLYTWWQPIYFRPPPSVFTIAHSVCVSVCFRETQHLIELTYMGSRVV